MYLATAKRNGILHYVIRESYRDGECLRSRDLADLGPNPAQHIVYPGGNGFYYRPQLEDHLQAQGVQYDSTQLDEIFLPFLDPHIRRVLEMFSSGPRSRLQRRPPCSPDHLRQELNHLHDFDFRRLHFLRCGRVDIGHLDDRHLGFASILIGKSRDEIECLIAGMEPGLRPHEARPYLYCALNLQSHFQHHLLRGHPEALDPRKLDEIFLDGLCTLNRSELFFQGVAEHDSSRLHAYLTRYAVLYFDNAFHATTRWHHVFREYLRGRHARRQSSLPVSYLPTAKALEILGIDADQLKAMSRKDLLRLFRLKAKELHPDVGGCHDAFVKLTEAYESLLATK